jgi:hypothetical protein
MALMPRRISEGETQMTGRWSRLALAAILLPAALPVPMAFAQTQTPPPSRAEGPSPEVRGRLLDGRMAMIRESLKLTDAQQKLWAPVEAQLRAAHAARQKARAERQAGLQGGERKRLAPPDRLDRASQRAAARAAHLKALAEVFRPFYASLSDEQKAVAAVVLKPMWRERGFESRRWALRHTRSTERR